MPNLTDARFDALRAKGYTGATSDMLLQWLQANSLPAVPKTIPDAWREALLKVTGRAAGNYQRSDYWFAYLGDLGFTGSMADRELQFWEQVGGSPLEPGLAWAAGSSEAIIYGSGSTELVPQFVGEGAPTFSTPDNLYLPDFEGAYHLAGLNAPPWYGARRVRNLLAYSEDLSKVSNWGGDAATAGEPRKVTFVNGYVYQEYVIGDPVGHSFTTRVRLRGDGVVLYEIRVGLGSASKIATANITLTDEYQTFSISGLCSENPGAASTVSFFIETVSATWLEVAEGNGAQLEEVTGQSSQNPSEYIKTDATPVSVYLSSENGNTVVDNVVAEGTGNHIVPTPGYYIAPSATNLISNSRDLTGWTLRGATVSYDQTGIAGEPNTASACAITLTEDMFAVETGLTPGNPLYVSIWIKATSFVGGFNILNPNDSPSGQWVVDMSMLSGEWEILTDEHPAVLVIQPFVVSPAGEAGLFFKGNDATQNTFIVGNCQQTELVQRGLSPIFTQGSAGTVAANTITYPIDNHSDVEGAYYLEWTPMFDSPGPVIHMIGDSLIYKNENNSTLFNFDGTGAASVDMNFQSGDSKKAALAYGDSLRSLNVDGVYGAEVAYDGSFPVAGTALYIGLYAQAVSIIGDLRRYDLPYDQAKAKIDDLMT